MSSRSITRPLVHETRRLATIYLRKFTRDNMCFHRRRHEIHQWILKNHYRGVLPGNPQYRLHKYCGDKLSQKKKKKSYVSFQITLRKNYLVLGNIGVDPAVALLAALWKFLQKKNLNLSASANPMIKLVLFSDLNRC